MSDQQAKHYTEAERLLREGERVVAQINDVKDNRALKRKELSDSFTGAGSAIDLSREIDRLTDRMDELGKKAMGIWAQAQVHATLATVTA